MQFNGSLLHNYIFMKIIFSFLILFSFSFISTAQTGKLFLVAGQSNAVGQGTSSLSSVCAPGTAFEYNALTNAVQHLQDPMGQTATYLEAANTGSIGPSFAKTLNTLTSKPIYMISAARGGCSNCSKGELSPYGTWDDAGNLMIFDYAVNKVNKAINSTGLALSGIIWLQGERDANAILSGNETEAEYQASLEKVIARFRTNFGPKLPFYIVLTGLQTDVATDGNLTVRKIQMQVAKKMQNVFVAFTSTNTYPVKGWMKDNVHYIQSGLNEIGDSVARLVATIPYDTIRNVVVPTDYQPNANNLQIVVDNTDTGCTFDTPWATSSYVTGFKGLNYAQDGNPNTDPTKWAKWTPTIPQYGKYRVYMNWTSGTGRPIIAPVEIRHEDGVSNLTIDQSLNGGKWNYLGIYNFKTDGTGSVKLMASAVGSTIADAVLFEQINDVSSIQNPPKLNNYLTVTQDINSSVFRVSLNLETPAKVSVSVYSILGKELVRIIDNKTLQSKNYKYSFNSNLSGKGIYIARLVIDNKPVQNLKFLCF